MPKQQKQQVPERISDFQRLILWLRAIGVAGIVVGGVAAMASFYWVGIWTLYGGLLVTLIDVLILERFEDRRYKIGIVVGLLALGAVVYHFVIDIDTRLEVSGQSMKGDYAKGTLVQGRVEWNPAFQEVFLNISNISDHPYKDLDFVVKPRAFAGDVAVTHFIELSEPVTCKVSQDPGMTFADTETPTEGFISPDSKISAVPTSHAVRIMCDKLNAHDTIRFLVVGSRGDTQPLPKIPIDAVSVSGQFVAFTGLPVEIKQRYQLKHWQ